MKNERHEKILELIRKKDIGTQDELASQLTQAGFSVTQATVSRDIRQLHLTKTTTEKGKTCYCSMQEGEANVSLKYTRILREAVLSIDPAGNLMVIKTVSGMAMAAAAAIDHLGIDEIIGSIAGDDTIMCAVRSQSDTKQAMNRIGELLR